jgi:hypothetical protein
MTDCEYGTYSLENEDGKEGLKEARAVRLCLLPAIPRRCVARTIIVRVMMIMSISGWIDIISILFPLIDNCSVQYIYVKKMAWR